MEQRREWKLRIRGEGRDIEKNFRRQKSAKHGRLSAVILKEAINNFVVYMYRIVVNKTQFSVN